MNSGAPWRLSLVAFCILSVSIGWAVNPTGRGRYKVRHKATTEFNDGNTTIDTSGEGRLRLTSRRVRINLRNHLVGSQTLGSERMKINLKFNRPLGKGRVMRRGGQGQFAWRGQTLQQGFKGAVKGRVRVQKQRRGRFKVAINYRTVFDDRNLAAGTVHRGRVIGSAR